MDSIGMNKRFGLAPEYTISRVIKGGWQLAGGHGTVAREQALDDMLRYVDAGITTFDCADIYTGVEALIGDFLRRHPDRSASVQVHTKYVPDLDSLRWLSRADVESSIDRSLRRLRLDRLDLVQFHWWDYDIPGYVETAFHLDSLRRAGKIRHIGLTNFDVRRMEEVLESGVRIVSNQVQYSVLDHRPERGMVGLCRQHGGALLCYGTVAGGFLSDRYLGAPKPEPPFENRSLIKYGLIVDDFGGWALFQELLTVLQRIGHKHGESISNIASRYVLQKPGVGAAIVGMRHARHLPDTLRLFDFELDAEDVGDIERVVERGQGPAGDVYSVEREKTGKHAAIMKYNLSSA